MTKQKEIKTYTWEQDSLQKYGVEITSQLIEQQREYEKNKGVNNCKGCGSENEGSVVAIIKTKPIIIHFGLWTNGYCNYCGKHESIKPHPKEKLYVRYDIQDETEVFIETLRDMKAFLIDFWEWHNDDQLTEQELNRFILNIQKATEVELFNYLGGIDYTFDEKDDSNLLAS